MPGSLVPRARTSFYASRYIAAFLAEQDVRFLGFELPPAVCNTYRSRFPDDPAMIRLDRWHQFELENPDKFIGMYVFWLQKG
jgi:hypothetical protein